MELVNVMCCKLVLSLTTEPLESVRLRHLSELCPARIEGRGFFDTAYIKF